MPAIGAIIKSGAAAVGGIYTAGVAAGVPEHRMEEVYSDSHANIWREFVPDIPLESEEFQAFIAPSRPIEEKQQIIKHFANDTDDRLWRGEDWSRIVKIQEEIVRRQSENNDNEITLAQKIGAAGAGLGAAYLTRNLSLGKSAASAGAAGLGAGLLLRNKNS